MKPTALKTLANVAILILALFVNPASQAQQSAQAVPEFDAARRQAYFDYATTHPGNALEGRTIFHNTVRASCSKCHTFDGSRKGGGPDLSAIGNKLDRTAMVRAVLFPSESIAIGYGTTQLLTTTGQLRSGILQRVTAEFVELKDAESQLIRVPVAEIESQTVSRQSLMPDAQVAAITQEEFADLIAFLLTLKQSRQGNAENPREIYEVDRAKQVVSFEPMFPSLKPWNHPVACEPIPQRLGQYLIVEQRGRIHLVDANDLQATPRLMLDHEADVHDVGATGLLGIAIHPQFPADPRLFLKYQRQSEGRLVTDIEERRWQTSPSGEVALVDPRLIIRIPAVTQDHNGGSIAFGPDGYLYIGMGDSGPQRDPQGHGQDLQTLLAKILRIDINATSGDLPYAIPSDNPFVNVADARGEIWAYGFREPWRISFDTRTGELWVGDVGQDRFEEVAVVKKGENHGWNVYEGVSNFSDQYRHDEANNPVSEFIDPVFSYGRNLGVSVTGGYVYRGQEAPALQGWYICGDFESRRVWAVKRSNAERPELIEIGRTPSRLVSFAQTHSGELLVVGFDDGVIQKMHLDQVDLQPARRKILVETSEEAPVLWRYTTAVPADDWNQSGFDDAAWNQAPGGFGTTGTPGGIIRTDWRTPDIWLRRDFDLSEAVGDDDELMLRIHHDEDVELYLNGTPLMRLSRWTSSYTEVALPKDAVKLFKAGRNSLAVHCHQNGGGQFIDCGFIVYTAK